MIIKINDKTKLIELYADNTGVVFTNEDTYNATIKMLLSEEQIKYVKGNCRYYCISAKKYKKYKATFIINKNK